MNTQVNRKWVVPFLGSLFGVSVFIAIAAAITVATSSVIDSSIRAAQDHQFMTKQVSEFDIRHDKIEKRFLTFSQERATPEQLDEFKDDISRQFSKAEHLQLFARPEYEEDFRQYKLVLLAVKLHLDDNVFDQFEIVDYILWRNASQKIDRIVEKYR